ncbi:hypothetical protein BN136_425 [Cronobacter universalis NCTC 9529]|nr:hypothetical protein BN136_425 [Cronobacter universalis NCTC 9529]
MLSAPVGQRVTQSSQRLRRSRFSGAARAHAGRYGRQSVKEIHQTSM